jgi:hypothetical protein
MSDVWYYAEGDKSVGPLTLSELKTILSRVSSARDVLVWRDGFSSWQTAKNVPELRPHVIKPPPLPPPPSTTLTPPSSVPPDLSRPAAATVKKYRQTKSAIFGSIAVVGVIWFVLYSDEAAKKDREAYEQCLKEHPLTAEQQAAKHHFGECFTINSEKHLLSDNQLKAALIGEGCYPDNRDDPLYDVAYAENYCDAQTLKKAYGGE